MTFPARIFVAAFAALVIMVMSTASAHAVGDGTKVTCQEYGEGTAIYCVANVEYFPQWKGYGYLDSMCADPFPAGYDGQPDATCEAYSVHDVYRYLGHNRWSKEQAGEMTRGYVHPFTKDWRWFYMGGQWHAVQADSLQTGWYYKRWPDD